ncbi:hypothetical protein EKL32_26935 [Flavobacterium sp. GSN2]|nr:hypothetical protein EKL32_26935 [Flavobacterium sp. GSN2]
MKTNIIRALFLKATKPKTVNYKVMHDNTPTGGKSYTIICENNLVFTKEQILQLEDAQADLLEQILKLRKVTKKLKSYEDNFKTNK